MNPHMREAGLRIPGHLLPRIGGMATMPSRSASLRTALPHIVGQVDTLFLYLDQHPEVPDYVAAHPKIIPLLPQQAGPHLGSAGKFLGLRDRATPCLYFCFDDDIIYADGYVDHMAAALRRHHHRCIVGLHAAVYAPVVESYVRNRRVFNFSTHMGLDVAVDELGTGTVAFHSSVIDVEPREWDTPNMTDLHFMIEAVRQQVPRLCVRREAGFLKAIAEGQPDSLFRKSLRDDSAETRLIQAAMRHYPGDWCLSPSTTHNAS